MILLAEHGSDLDFPVDEYDPEAEESLRYLRGILTLLGEQSLEGLEQVEAGACDDCGGGPLSRWRFGQFVICRRCIRRRQRAVPS